jgi:ribonuclease R/exosome complex exonuclease DIS3/RRP44
MHKNKQTKKLTGIIKITAKPIGFLMVDGLKSDSDVIIFEENLNCALDKDEVEVEIIGKDRDRQKGKVTKIIKRNKTQFVGTLEKMGNGLTLFTYNFQNFSNWI